MSKDGKKFADGYDAIFGKKSRNVTAADLPNKPAHSPTVDKWIKKGGKVEIDGNGTWVYTDWHGNSVAYPGGHPDFKAAGMVKSEVQIKPKYDGNYTTDYTKADGLSSVPRNPATDTWHHHQDLTTMQLVDRTLHNRFTHLGGVSMINNP